jgi:hypothetical protein
MITLPTDKDILVEFNIDGQVIKFDPMEVLDLQRDSYQLEETATNQITDSGWREYFIKLFETKYQINLSKTNSWILLEVCNKKVLELKKQYCPSQKSSDSTDGQEI